MIVGIGKAGNPDVMQGVSPVSMMRFFYILNGISMNKVLLSVSLCVSQTAGLYSILPIEPSCRSGDRGHCWRGSDPDGRCSRLSRALHLPPTRTRGHRFRHHDDVWWWNGTCHGHLRHHLHARAKPYQVGKLAIF